MGGKAVDVLGISPAAKARAVEQVLHPGDNIGADCSFQKWTPLRMLPESGSIP